MIGISGKYNVNPKNRAEQFKNVIDVINKGSRIYDEITRKINESSIDKVTIRYRKIIDGTMYRNGPFIHHEVLDSTVPASDASKIDKKMQDIYSRDFKRTSDSLYNTRL